MIVVIFRSRLREEHLVEYAAVAPRMLELARGMPGFVSFEDFASDGGERVALIGFETAENVRAWREHPEHLAAQKQGRALFYSEYRLQICEELRTSTFSFDDTARSPLEKTR